MRSLRVTGLILLSLGLIAVVVAWVVVWYEYQQNVEMRRFAMRPDAKVPPFDPFQFVNPATMPLNAVECYILAVAVGIPGIVCLALSRRMSNRDNR